MRRTIRILPAVIIIFVLVLAASSAQQADLTKPLSLAACIKEALARNLDLSVESFNPEINDAAVALIREKYLPQFDMTYDRQNQTNLGTWGLQGTNIRYKFDSGSAGFRQKIITGADLSLTLSNSMTDTSQLYTTINPSYYSALRFNLVQPLLKGFGPSINRIEINKAQNLRDSSLAQLKGTVIKTVTDVEQAYWNLLAAQENMKVQEASLAQSRELLKRSSEAARIGNKSALEVLNAETEVAGYEDAVVSARRRIEQQEEILRSLMNGQIGTGEAAEKASGLALTDQPSAESREISLDDAIRIALAERPEISASEKDLQSSADDVRYYRNQLLPQLDLSFSIWNPGQSGVKFLYQDNNPLTNIIIGKIAGGRIDSVSDIFRKYYQNWSLSLQFSLPLANIFSRAGLNQANLLRKQTEVRLERQKKTVVFEVTQAVKDLKNTEGRIKSSAAHRVLLEKRLEAERQRYDLGLVGSEWLFQYQRQLAQARTDEFQALVDNKLAVAALDKAMGMTLKKKGIKFRDFEF